jgi:NADH-quinone oxidoreductase subunit L
LAWQWYYRKPGTASALALKAKPLYSLLDHKYWVDEIYSRWLLVPILWFTRIFLGGLVEEGVVQGSGSAASATTRGLSKLTARMQSGNIRSYAGWLAFGAAVVIAVAVFTNLPVGR